MRKTYRLVMGLLFLIIYYFSPNRIPIVSVAGFFLLLMLILEVERWLHPGVWKWVQSHKTRAIFKERPGRLEGTTWFLIATLISVLLFERSIAICVLCFSVFGDAASGVIGSRFGRIKLRPSKSLEGSLAFFAACIVVGYIILLLPRLELSWPLIIWGGLAAAVIEVVSVRVDDNLSIPVFSGIVMELLRRFVF